MTLAIGLGCRRGCEAAVLVALVEAVRAGLPPGPARLFTADIKRDEPGLLAAARQLGLPLTFLPRAALLAVEPRLITPSPAAQAHLGLSSVSEAAALAGAGPGARLLGPRMVRDGATCAAATATAVTTLDAADTLATPEAP